MERPDLLYHTSVSVYEIVTHRTGRLDDIISEKSWGIDVDIKSVEENPCSKVYDVTYKLVRRRDGRTKDTG